MDTSVLRTAEATLQKHSQEKMFCFALQHGRSTEHLQHIFRTPFPKNIYEGLLLYVVL